MTDTGSDQSERVRLAKRLPRDGVGAEVGVWAGDHADLLWKTTRPYAMYLVDPYQRNSDLTNRSATVDTTQEEIDYVYARLCVKHLHRPGVVVLRAESLRGARMLTACGVSLDWAYIDARHDSESVSEDLRAWYPLVKPGGVLAGHDYQALDVRLAVREFARLHRLDVSVETGGRGSYWVQRNAEPSQATV